MSTKELRNLIRKIILENEEEKVDLEAKYWENHPRWKHQIDHNKAVKNPRLQAWKVEQKKYFMTHADHEWFNNNFVFVHWMSHSSGINRSQIAQLGRSLGYINKNSLTWEYDNMSAYGYSRDEFPRIVKGSNKLGIMMKDCRIGYAAMADMWTEEHWTLRLPDGDNTRNYYMNRYKSAMGIPKRPGSFDPKMAFLNEDTYNIVIAQDEFSGDPNIIDEVICERWKLDKILIPKDCTFKDEVYKLLEEHNYDINQITLEY